MLFNVTIGENILYSKLDASNKEITQAADDANALDFIMAQKDREVVKLTPDEMIQRYQAEKVKLIAMLGEEVY